MAALLLKEKQSGSYTLPSGSTSASITIDAVDTTKSVLVVTVGPHDEGTPSNLPWVILTSSTSIEIARVTSTGDVRIYWQLLEFHSGLSVQRVYFDADDLSNSGGFYTGNKTISSVAVDRSFVILSTRSATSTYSGNDCIIPDLTSSTNIRLRHSNTDSAGSVAGYAQVITFDGDSGAFVDYYEDTYSTSSTNIIFPITDKGTNYIAITYSTIDTTGEGPNGSVFRTRRVPPEFVQFARASSGVAGTMSAYVVYLPSETIRSVVISGNGGDQSASNTFTVVDSSRSWVRISSAPFFSMHTQNLSTSGAMGALMSSVTSFTDTSVEITRYSTENLTWNAHMEVVEFNKYSETSFIPQITIT